MKNKENRMREDMLKREFISFCYPATMFSNPNEISEQTTDRIKLYIVDVKSADRQSIGSYFIGAYSKETAEKEAAERKTIHGDREVYFEAKEPKLTAPWGFTSIERKFNKASYKRKEEIFYDAKYLLGGTRDRAFNAPFCNVRLSVETYERYVDEYLSSGKDFLLDKNNKPLTNETTDNVEDTESKKIMEAFPTGSTWHFINSKGRIESFIIHSGLSPLAASKLGKVYVLYRTWEEANNALKEYNKTFRTFKD